MLYADYVQLLLIGGLLLLLLERVLRRGCLLHRELRLLLLLAD